MIEKEGMLERERGEGGRERDVITRKPRCGNETEPITAGAVYDT